MQTERSILAGEEATSSVGGSCNIDGYHYIATTQSPTTTLVRPPSHHNTTGWLTDLHPSCHSTIGAVIVPSQCRQITISAALQCPRDTAPYIIPNPTRVPEDFATHRVLWLIYNLRCSHFVKNSPNGAHLGVSTSVLPITHRFRSKRRNKDQGSRTMMVRRSRRINSKSEANGSAQSERRNKCTRTKKETVKNRLKKMKHERKRAERKEKQVYKDQEENRQEQVKKMKHERKCAERKEKQKNISIPPSKRCFAFAFLHYSALVFLSSSSLFLSPSSSLLTHAPSPPSSTPSAAGLLGSVSRPSTSSVVCRLSSVVRAAILQQLRPPLCVRVSLDVRSRTSAILQQRSVSHVLQFAARSASVSALLRPQPQPPRLASTVVLCALLRRSAAFSGRTGLVRRPSTCRTCCVDPPLAAARIAILDPPCVRTSLVVHPREPRRDGLSIFIICLMLYYPSNTTF
ncbi:uncharacterized protein G2W53_039660 [Senna tora]|uniref:Uncharacterized protein n=1 Tax=Senna tora TaxID=362788 RepID=A0A834W866_9FABA|nr:uncharacterized protein G2W53_039660 [Senna tora]